MPHQIVKGERRPFKAFHEVFEQPDKIKKNGLRLYKNRGLLIKNCIV